MNLTGVLAPILTIWSLVGIALLVWYLWALARLFPRIGLPASAGWIPIWNQWRLIDRAGLPGWLAVLLVVPVLAIVPYVCSIIAMHRVNRAAGVGAEYTVLGAFLPPLWATLLAAELSADAPLTQPVVPQSAPAAPAPVAPTYARAGGGATAPPSAAQTGLPALPQPQPQGHPDAVPQPYRSQQSTPPSVAPAYFGHADPGAAPAAASNTRATGAPADDAGASGAEDEPWRQLGHGDLPVAPDSLRPEADRRAARARSGPAGSDEWWLGLTTEQEYARLASEEQSPQQAPLRPSAPPRAFAWPGPEPTTPHDADAAAHAEVVPPLHPVAESVQPAAPTETTDPSRRFRPPVAAPQSDASMTPDGRAHGETEDLGGLDEDLERTVVARRPRTTGWVIELEDGTTIPLAADDIVIGRKPASDEALAVTIPDVTRTLSKSHARLRRTADGWTIEDLDSTNGVALVHEDGREADVAPRTATLATRRLIIGTMRIVLTRESSAE
ncbi:hypothetical protein GCM10009847_03300 [Leucobacter tardus]|uniref:FHA domain-containing protein n=1 Tax=Leucobacter tardus TaxID=501483 RepID=A0A939QE65_9MICO|nr:DUF5684 domain-containing protein [Leucobacter tardus]MBO2988538.1 FHA domain-containing protein [Leucobacter tardus]